MKIEVYEAKSDDWQKVCAPIQRGMTAKKGGLILIFSTKDKTEAEVINTFANQIFKKIRVTSQAIVGDVNCSDLYSEFSQDYSRTYLLIYQLFATKSNLSGCFEAVGKLINEFSEILGQRRW